MLLQSASESPCGIHDVHKINRFDLSPLIRLKCYQSSSLIKEVAGEDMQFTHWIIIRIFVLLDAYAYLSFKTKKLISKSY